MTSRELVTSTLEFRNTEDRVPRQLWSLAWAGIHYPRQLEALLQDFVWDIDVPPVLYAEAPATSGSPFEIGEYVDEWGCRFSNITRGMHRGGESPAGAGAGLERHPSCPYSGGMADL